MLIHATLVISLLVAPAATAADPECGQLAETIGQCPIVVPDPDDGGDSVEITGQETDPGNPGRNPGGRDEREHVPAPPPPPTPEEIERCLRERDDEMLCFELPGTETEEETPAIPAVTITDVARFAPSPVVVAGEPDDAGVAGLPTNFVASGSTHVVHGTLFDYAVSVRFTPVGFDFHYGDGATTTTATGGRSWEALGQAQFTPTPTSHAYAARGTYLARVDVRYAAEVDFGIGWFPISGELRSAGEERSIRIFEARTALVNATCAENPAGPGC